MANLLVKSIGGFSRAMARMMQPHARVKPFTEPKFKVNIQPLKNPLKSKIGPKNRLRNFFPKMLQYKSLTYKRLLIVIVGP